MYDRCDNNNVIIIIIYVRESGPQPKVMGLGLEPRTFEPDYSITSLCEDKGFIMNPACSQWEDKISP